MPKTQTTQPVKRSARIAGLQLGPLPPLPTSKRRGRKPRDTSNDRAGAAADEDDEEAEQDTDAEIDQLADDTSLIGLIPLRERQSMLEHHQRFANSLGEETLEDVFAELDKYDSSSDQYKEDDPETVDVIDIESSESSFALVEDSDEEPGQVKQEMGATRQVKTEKEPTSATPKSSFPAVKTSKVARSLSHSYSDNNSEEDTPATGVGSKRKRVEPKGSGRKASNKTRKTSASSQVSKSKSKNPPKPQRRRTSSTRRRSKPAKDSEDEDGGSGEEQVELEDPLDFFILNIPVGDPTDKNDKAMKPVKLSFDTSYETYQYKVADITGNLVSHLPRYSWKFGDAKQNANTTILQTEEEFDTMIEHTREKGMDVRDQFMGELAKKGSKSAGKSTMCQKPVQVCLVQKAVPVAKGRKSGAGGASTSSYASKPQPSIFDYEADIKGRNKCTSETCDNRGGMCWEIADLDTREMKHRELSVRDVKLWANLVHQGKAELMFPPPVVLAGDVRTKKAETKVVVGSKTGTSPVGASRTVGNPSTQPGATSSNRNLLGLEVKAPLLSVWLLTCDQNKRGEKDDKFSWMVFGFDRLDICRLTDLRDVKPEFLQSLELEQEEGSTKKMTMGLALRLARLIQEDLKVYDQMVSAMSTHNN